MRFRGPNEKLLTHCQGPSLLGWGCCRFMKPCRYRLMTVLCRVRAGCSSLGALKLELE
jgi:hypothetical protein